jgi:hypothetical protein|tara:strand:- start:154 stop:591 length:438 start_codon:yes stop_codon:yes gene_type:complete
MIDAANDRKYGYAGLIPLAVGFAGALFAVSGSVEVFLDYSLLVLMFLTGSCWGALRTKKKKAEDWQLGFTIAIFLWGWFASYLPDNLSVLMLLVAFWMLRFLETDKVFGKVYTEGYRALRGKLTWVVSALHILVFVLINYTDQVA